MSRRTNSIALAFWIVATTRAFASIVSPDLPVGSQYQLIFVTQGKLPATSADISTYNQFVDDQAALDPLLPHTTWHAVASVPGVDARVNAPSFGLPVYNTQAILVSPADPDLYKWSAGAVLNPILYDQFGSPYDGGPGTISPVWTGTDGGVGRPGLALGEGSFAGPGSAKFTGTSWIADGQTSSSTPLPLYALSDPITIVPEPESIAIWSELLIVAVFAVSRAKPERGNRTA